MFARFAASTTSSSDASGLPYKILSLILALNRANLDRLRCDFYDAIKGYKSILAEYPLNAEANWGLVLATYGIEYVKDTKTNKYLPTCHRVIKESILNHPNYLKATKNAAEEQKAIFTKRAQQIDKLQKAIKRKISGNEIVQYKGQKEPTKIINLMEALQKSLVASPNKKKAQ